MYFSNDRGKDQALKQAEKELAYLNQNSVSFSEARSRGDFFLFNANYVERTPDYVASHFGKSMTQSVFELEPSEEQWYGPFESPYGFHLVMLTKREEGRYPAFDEVRQRVMGDAELEAKRAKQEETIQSIIDAYDVRITFQQNG